jgi:hypothetical protein
MNTKILRSVVLAVSMCLLLAPLAAIEKSKVPETTKDGLHLQHQTKHGVVYLKPGATLDAYTQVKILDVYVAFHKNWQRNFNDDQASLENRVTDKDMDKIKARVAKEFPIVFTKVLEKGGYQVVDTTGKDVLLLRPAIINLVVTAPDLMTAGMTTNMVSSSGSMTLYMELYDSLTSAKIAEVLDSEEAGNNSFAHVANRVTNKADFDLTLEAWAKILVKRLDEAHGTASK